VVSNPGRRTPNRLQIIRIDATPTPPGTSDRLPPVFDGVQVESIVPESVRRGVAALNDLQTVAALKRSLSP